MTTKSTPHAPIRIRPFDPVPCLACGFDLGISGNAGRPWHMVDTAAGLFPVCDLHPAGDVRDAVASVERPEALEPSPQIGEIPPPLPVNVLGPESEAPPTPYELAMLTALGNPMDEPYPIHSREALIEAFRAGYDARSAFVTEAMLVEIASSLMSVSHAGMTHGAMRTAVARALSKAGISALGSDPR